MPLDGVVLSSVVYELNGLLTGGRVEKINQTEKDEIVLTCHTASGKYNLLCSANPSNPRLHLTCDRKDNPLSAPPFCMVLRKHIKGGRVTSVVQSSFDRIVTVNFEVFDELEGATEKHLIVEIMGKYSNIILTGKTGIIYDAIRHIDSSMSSVREILPARYYQAPPPQDKISPVSDSLSAFTEALNRGSGPIRSLILSVVSGFSPMLCGSVCDNAGIDPRRNTETLSDDEKSSIVSVMGEFFAEITSSEFKPKCFYEEQDAGPCDFHCISKVSAGVFFKEFSTSNMMLDEFYTERDRLFRLSQKKNNLLKKINSAIEHCERKNEIYLKTIADKNECESLRIKGELIKTYIYMIEKGSDSFTCINYFDEEQKEITFSLDKNLSPAANGAACFKKYRKQKSAIENAEKFYRDCNLELQYLENVKTLLENTTEEQVVSETKDELSGLGYIKPEDTGKNPKNKKSSAPKAESSPLRTFSSDGYEILIGKNNRQNDMLTFRTAAPDDIWLHIKDAPGSHVILKTKNGVVSGKAIEEAAAYAAGYSSIKGETKALVDYTRAKHVKKQSGARPGMVIFTNNKTISVLSKKLKNQ